MPIQQQILSETIVGEDSTNPLHVVYHDSGNLAIDYSAYFERVATAAETIATNSNTIAANLTTIAQKITTIEAHQKKIKELGEGPGYRIIGPYEIFSMVTIYKLLIEEGKILDLDGTNVNKTAQSLAKVLEYMQKISTNIPKDF